jgi:transcriptional regulator with XRE-family HTH domain
MKQRNTEVKMKIKGNTPICQAVRRSDFPLQIRLKMAEKGLKNVDIAERIGVSEANVSRWLRGNQNLSIDTMYLLADAIEESLTIALGAQQDVRNVDADGYESHAGEAFVIEGRAELEASALLEDEGPCAKVVHMKDYVGLRGLRTASHYQFAPALSELGIEYSERMVN